MAKPIIMTIDDEPQVLNTIERDLRGYYHSGYRIIKVGSGTEALETVRQLKRRNAPIALFLVDQRMPGMSGFDLHEKLSGCGSKLEVIFITGDPQAGDREHALRSGAAAFLKKPFEAQALIDALDTAFARISNERTCSDDKET